MIRKFLKFLAKPFRIIYSDSSIRRTVIINSNEVDPDDPRVKKVSEAMDKTFNEMNNTFKVMKEEFPHDPSNN